MRLNNYLTETKEEKRADKLNALMPTIKKECKSWLSQTHSIGVVFRGMMNVEIIKKTVRKNRKPLDTTKEKHNLLDAAFKEHFGWNARSDGLFVSPDVDKARYYGPVNLILPIGKVKYLCQKNIRT